MKNRLLGVWDVACVLGIQARHSLVRRTGAAAANYTIASDVLAAKRASKNSLRAIKRTSPSVIIVRENRRALWSKERRSWLRR